MSLSWEAVILAVFILLPGFAYTSTSATFSAPERHRPSDFQLMLRSLAVSTMVLAAEAMLVTLISLAWPSLEHELISLVRDGVQRYGERHPQEVLLAATAVALVNTSLLALAGWIGFPRQLIQKQQYQRGITPWRVWIDVLDTINASPATAIGARVYLATDGVYAGALAGWSLAGEEQGGPDLGLWNPVFTDGQGDDDWIARGTAVVIPAREIRCFELYTEQDSNTTMRNRPTNQLIRCPDD